MPIYLKIAGIDRDPMKRAVVQLVGDLAGQLDAWILAEGVETRGELTELIRQIYHRFPSETWERTRTLLDHQLAQDGARLREAIR